MRGESAFFENVFSKGCKSISPIVFNYIPIMFEVVCESVGDRQGQDMSWQHAAAHSTWERIVLPFEIEKRACVFCGCVSEMSKKVAGIEFVQDIIDSQPQAVQNDALASTINNICASATAAHALLRADKVAGRTKKNHAILCACHSCHHWVNRRYKLPNFLLPLQALGWYVNTLKCITKKNLDHRVVFRLSCVLTRPGADGLINYYRSQFSEQELDLFANISSNTVHDVAPKVAAYYYARYGFSMFLNSSKLVEYIRRGLHDDSEAEADAA